MAISMPSYFSKEIKSEFSSVEEKKMRKGSVLEMWILSLLYEFEMVFLVFEGKFLIK